jgi:hypothetical protein
MKTLHKLASRLFLGVLLFAAGAAHAQFTYTTNNGTITITGYTGPDGAVTIPDVIDGLPVTDIGTNAFAGADLTSVVIPDSVANIGDYGFYYCVNLTNVSIPDSVTNIGAYAFSGATTGTSGGGTYPVIVSGCPLTSITIPNSVTSIGADAFYGCLLLTNVTIGVGLTSIGDSAFVYCSDLTAINVALNNSAYTSIGGVLFNKSATTLVQFPDGVVGSYSIPSGVTDIESNAFADCSLTNVTIGDSVTNIGDYAFYDCSLINVTMGSNVASIGNYAFSGTVYELSGFLTVLVPLGCPLTSVTIPNSVTSIGNYAFYGCYGLTNVTFGDSVASIGNYAFSGLAYSGLSSTPLGCPLASVTIPNSVTNIGPGAFAGCGSLTNVTFGVGLTSIGDYAFEECGSTDAYFLGNAPSADSSVFSYDTLTAYYLPGTTGWAEFTTNTGVPTALWTLPYPLILNGSSGVRANQFGFTITWATNVPVVVEASTDLSRRVWTPIATNTLSSGTSLFTDPDWKNYPNRFYRIRSQ